MRCGWTGSTAWACLSLEDEGFDFSVLSEFQARLVAGGMEQAILAVLLGRLKGLGLVKAGGRQRTDSTHVLAAIRGLSRLELVGESVRAALQALAAAAPGWLAGVIDGSWQQVYGLFNFERAPSVSSLTIGGCAGCSATVLGGGSCPGS